MLEEAGYSARDLLHAADDAGVRMAIFNGIVKETRHQVGDAAKLADELGGALSRTEESTKKVHRAIGAAIEGPLRQLLNTIQPILERLAEWIERNKELVGIILTVATAVAALTTSGAAWLLLIPKISEALKLLTGGPVGLAIIGLTALVTVFVAVKNATRKAREEQEQYIERKKELADKIGNEARELNTLLDEYDRLVTKTNRTKEEHEKLNDVVAKIGNIAPEAATKWDNLGNAIEINAGKARQAAKDMLEARKSLLEVAVARAEFEIPQQEAIIKKNEKAVLAAKKRLDDAKASLNEAVRLQAEAQRIQNRILAGDPGEDVYQDALTSGVVAFEGASLPLAVESWLNHGIQDAEKEITKAANKLDKVSEGYYDAKEKLAQISADKAELTATIAEMNKGNLYAGLDGKSGGEGEGPGKKSFDEAKYYDQLDKELQNIDKLAATFGDTSDVAKDKASALRKAIIELVENGVDPTNTAMGNLVEQYQGYAKETEEAKKETYNLTKAKNDLWSALMDVDQQAAIFGDTLDTDRERLNLFQNAIIDALTNKEPIENIQDLIDEYNALKEEIDAATTAEQNNKAATDLLTQAQEYLYRMTGKVVPEWEQFAQKLEDMAGKDGVLPEVAQQLLDLAEEIRKAGQESVTVFGMTFTQEMLEAFAKAKEVMSEWYNFTVSITSRIQDIYSQLYKNRSIALDNWYKREKDAIKNSQKSEEEKKAAFEALDEEYDQKKREMMRRQAAAEKNLAIFNIFVNTARAVVEALPNMILSGIISALGFAQFMAVQSQPLPELAEGGLAVRSVAAIIGEGRDEEAILPLNESVFARLAEGILNQLAKMKTSALQPAGMAGAEMLEPEVIHETNFNLYPGILIGNKEGYRQLARELYPYMQTEKKRRGEE